MNTRKLVSFDWALKRLLRSKANYEILEGFLSELLRDDIQILELLESEGNRDHPRDRANRVDLKVRNRNQEILLIEVQYEREFDFLQRILFATAKAITEHLVMGEPYDQVIKVISINILHFDLGHGKDYVYHGKTRFLGLHHHDELRLNNRQQELFGRRYPHELYPEYYLLKVNQFDDIARDSLDEWIYLLKNQEVKEEFRARGLREAKQVLDILNLEEKERRAYEQYAEDLSYQASLYHSSYHDGRLDGRDEGREEGREEHKMEMAKAMKAGQEPMGKIQKYTQLSIEEIEKL